MLKDVLAHPLTRGLAVDDPQTSVLRRQIIQEKKFLRLIYQEWYQLLTSDVPCAQGPILEIGIALYFVQFLLRYFSQKHLRWQNSPP